MYRLRSWGGWSSSLIAPRLRWRRDKTVLVAQETLECLPSIEAPEGPVGAPCPVLAPRFASGRVPCSLSLCRPGEPRGAETFSPATREALVCTSHADVIHCPSLPPGTRLLKCDTRPRNKGSGTERHPRPASASMLKHVIRSYISIMFRFHKVWN